MEEEVQLVLPDHLDLKVLQENQDYQDRKVHLVQPVDWYVPRGTTQENSP